MKSDRVYSGNQGGTTTHFGGNICRLISQWSNYRGARGGLAPLSCFNGLSGTIDF